MCYFCFICISVICLFALLFPWYLFLEYGNDLRNSCNHLAEIVTLHGGSITVLSEGTGQGCSFIVKIPLFQVEESSARVAPRVNQQDESQRSVSQQAAYDSTQYGPVPMPRDASRFRRPRRSSHIDSDRSSSNNSNPSFHSNSTSSHEGDMGALRDKWAKEAVHTDRVLLPQEDGDDGDVGDNRNSTNRLFHEPLEPSSGHSVSNSSVSMPNGSDPHSSFGASQFTMPSGIFPFLGSFGIQLRDAVVLNTSDHFTQRMIEDGRRERGVSDPLLNVPAAASGSVGGNAAGDDDDDEAGVTERSGKDSLGRLGRVSLNSSGHAAISKSFGSSVSKSANENLVFDDSWMDGSFMSRSIGIFEPSYGAKRWETGLHFLIVDDSTLQRKIMRSMLVCHGHEVRGDGRGCEVDLLVFLEQSYTKSLTHCRRFCDLIP